jgi:hypothetical protein
MSGRGSPVARTGVALALWLILVYGIALAWVPTHWAEFFGDAALLGMAAIAAVVWLIRGIWPVGSWLLLPIALAPVRGLAQIVFGTTADPYRTQTAALSLTALAGAFVLGTYAFANRRANRLFRVLAVISGGVLAALSIAQLFTSDGLVYWSIRSLYSTQPMGPFLNRDNYSAFIELVLPLALWEATRSTRSAWFFGVPAAIMYASVIAGESRAGSILVTLEALVVLVPALVLRRRAGWGAMPRAIATAVLIVVFSTFVGWEDLLARFNDKDPYATRREYVESSLLMIRDRPLAGSGLGTWSIVYPRYAVIDMQAASYHAHNDWLEWACDGGLPFLFLMLIPVARGSWLALRYPWGLGVLAASLHALVDFPFRVWCTPLCLILLVAALEARNSMARDEMPDTIHPFPC